MSCDILLYSALPAELRESIEAGSSRSVCPKCDGGSSREASLDVRQDETAHMRLKCWRSTCDWYAITVTDPDARIQSKSIKPPSVYREETAPIAGEMLDTLVGAYGLDPECFTDHGWTMSPNGRTLVMPILDANGLTLGHVTRTFESPKRCYTFKATAQPWLDHWYADTGGPLVVVEDCLSACRLQGAGYDAIALLGTSISCEQAREIAEVAGEQKVVLALDNDAFIKSLSLANRHSHIVKMYPILLTTDIKNLGSDDEIHHLLKAYGHG